MKTSTTQRGFTLIEMLVVIAIVGLLAAFTVPAIKNMNKGDVMVAATRQMLDDIGRARQLAISRHTTVYMVFCPSNFWNDPYAGGPNRFTPLPTAEQDKGTNLYGKQLTGYTFVTLRSIGEQPGRTSPEYIGPWQTMPDESFIPLEKFYYDASTFYNVTNPNAASSSFQVYGFARTNNIPFPSDDATPGPYVTVPYIAFNYLGQLVSGNGGDEYIPLMRGSVVRSRDPASKAAAKAAPRLVPDANSSNILNLVRIDRLTGRARLIKQELQ